LAQERGHGRHSPDAPSTTAAARAPVAVDDDDLRVFLELTDEIYGMVDEGRRLVWMNRAGERHLGYEPGELAGTDLALIVHPDDAARAADALAEVRGGADVAPGEVRYRRRDGSWCHLELSASVDAGSGTVVAAGRDVTDRYEARAALRDNEKLMQAILDHSTAAVFVKDHDGRYVLVNDTFLRPLGFSAEQVLGKTREEIWPATSADDIDRVVMETREAIVRDDAVELDDGTHMFMTVRFPLLVDGAVVGMAAIASDVTDRSRAEHVLAEQERLLDTIVRACPDVVTMIDREGRVREISQASTRILGYELDDPVHTDLQALIHPDDLPMIFREYGRLLTLETRQLDIRYRVRHRDGHWVTLDTRGQAIVGEDGQPAGAVVVSRDITADLAFEQELEAAVAEAEQASTAKSEFLSRMSHELRTPLNSVLGFAQLLQMDHLDAQQREAVGHILRAGHHLLNLIDEVLDIARIESGRLDLSVEPVGLRALIADAVDLTKPVADDREIAVVVSLPGGGGDPHVLADRQRLLQVLLNLLSNGVKYNEQGGSVTVAVTVDGPTTAISVTDTGPGIEPADMARVFEPFDRLGAERSGVEGTGVGLTLSKYLVEQMGGTISLDSRPGSGTTFTVSLATADAPHPPEVGPGPGDEHHEVSGALRVLHIEDNLANLQLVEQVLARLPSVELHAAMSGSLGLELARERRPDVVLLDLHLPDMTGIEVLEQLQRDPDTASVPVVVVSADATPEQMRKLKEAGARAYLTKPVDVQELLRLVQTLGAEGAASGSGAEGGGS
jgi:PAS domain S-box-containing protein